MEHRWKKGQSGNPAGRPPGTGKQALIRKEVERQIEDMGVSRRASELLRQNSEAVTQEVLRIALAPEKETVTTKEENGATVITVTRRPGDSKIRCLIAVLERLVPSLKSVEVKDQGPRTADQMSDQEIIDLMHKMVFLARGGPLNPNPGDEGPQVH